MTVTLSENAVRQSTDGRPPVVTVFTASYNRAHTLPRLLDSLVRQDFRPFEWVIVDDGSTDNTGAWVAEVAPTAPFPVRYFRQDNQGKHIAFNRGVQEAAGEFFLSVDSDDALLPQALTNIVDAWHSIPADRRSEFTGVTGLCCDEHGRPIGDLFERSPLDSDSATLTLLGNLQGDKIGFHRTEVLRAHKFPSDLNTRFVPEGRVWIEIAQELKTRFVNIPYSTVFDSGPGRLSSLNRATRAEGDLDYFGYALRSYGQWAGKRPIQFFKMAINFNRAAYHLGRREKIGSTSMLVKAMNVLAKSPAYVLYFRDLVKAHGELGAWIAISRQLPNLAISPRIGNLFRKLYLRKTRPAVRCRANDLTMDLEPWECVDGWVLFYPHLFDREEIDFLAGRLPPDGIFLDVGSNIGFYAITLARHLPDGRSIAIEADPYNVDKLRKNVALSYSRNVIVVPEGVSDKEETLSFRLNTSGNRGGNSFASDAPGERIEIACRSLLQILESNQIARVNAMKIDIEGFEYPVLHAFFATAPRSLFPKAIVIEIVPGWEERGGGDVLSMLLAHGYRVYAQHEHNFMLDLAGA